MTKREESLAIERTILNSMFVAFMEQLEVLNTKKYGNYQADVKHKEKQDLVLFKKIGSKLFKPIEKDSEKEGFRAVVDFIHESNDMIRKNIVLTA
jgi:hypothetical protein